MAPRLNLLLRQQLLSNKILLVPRYLRLLDFRTALRTVLPPKGYGADLATVHDARPHQLDTLKLRQLMTKRLPTRVEKPRLLWPFRWEYREWCE